MLLHVVTRKGLGLEQVCLRLAWSMWVLDFVQEEFHKMSPGALESVFITAGTVKRGRARDRSSSRRDWVVLLWPSGDVIGRTGATQAAWAHREVKVSVTEMGQGGAAFSSLKSHRKGGLGDGFRGLAQDDLPLPTAPRVASLREPLGV